MHCTESMTQRQPQKRWQRIQAAILFYWQLILWIAEQENRDRQPLDSGNRIRHGTPECLVALTVEKEGLLDQPLTGVDLEGDVFAGYFVSFVMSRLTCSL